MVSVPVAYDVLLLSCPSNLNTVLHHKFSLFLKKSAVAVFHHSFFKKNAVLHPLKEEKGKIKD